MYCFVFTRTNPSTGEVGRYRLLMAKLVNMEKKCLGGAPPDTIIDMRAFYRKSHTSPWHPCFLRPVKSRSYEWELEFDFTASKVDIPPQVKRFDFRQGNNALFKLAESGLLAYHAEVPAGFRPDGSMLEEEKSCVCCETPIDNVSAFCMFFKASVHPTCLVDEHDVRAAVCKRACYRKQNGDPLDFVDKGTTWCFFCPSATPPIVRHGNAGAEGQVVYCHGLHMNGKKSDLGNLHSCSFSMCNGLQQTHFAKMLSRRQHYILGGIITNYNRK